MHEISYSSPAVRAELERLALRDPSETVRAAALAALDLPAQRNVRARLNQLSLQERRLIAREIQEWQAADLLEKETATVLLKRYTFDLTPAPQVQAAPAEKPAPQTPPPTLAQTLLSETSVKIALYLGAFFVVSAAAIFAALVEMARLPILFFGMIFFGAMAVALRKRLPQPSFTLFVVFSFLLPITANVIEESLNLSAPFAAGYWVFVSCLMAFIWAGASWLYQSRLFSVAAFAALTVAFFRVGDVFNLPGEFSTLMVGLAALAGLAGTWLLKDWRDFRFALPLFLAAQALQAGALAVGLTFYFINLMDSTASPLWNLALLLAWGCASAFYILSEKLRPFALFPWFAAGALTGPPFFFAAAFELGEFGGAMTFAIWGFFLAAVSEIAPRLSKSLQKYNLPLLLAAVSTSVFGVFTAFAYNQTAGFFVALWFALVFGALHFIRPRGLLWALALFDFMVAYFTFYALPFMQSVKVFLGYQLLGASVLMLGFDLPPEKEKSFAWRLPPRVYGALFAVFSAFFYLLLETEEVFRATLMFGGYAAFFLLYTLTYRKPIWLYAFTISFSFFVIFLLKNFGVERWIYPLTLLALGYYALGFVLRTLKLSPGWAIPLLVSGLAAGGVASLGALTFEDLAPAIVPAVAATLFAVEAFARKNAWLGLPANGLYLLSYFIILMQLKVDQPQFYSVGAALLGMIQHYLLIRAESKKGAFIMGMLSQLTLLGVTYVQMASTENLTYFFALFLQALTVIAYGAIVRSRSLVFTPIGILALGLLTVLYSALKGLGAVILVGCAGVILLGLGVLAVILREKISNLGEKLGDWKA